MSQNSEVGGFFVLRRAGRVDAEEKGHSGVTRHLYAVSHAILCGGMWSVRIRTNRLQHYIMRPRGNRTLRPKQKKAEPKPPPNGRPAVSRRLCPFNFPARLRSNTAVKANQLSAQSLGLLRKTVADCNVMRFTLSPAQPQIPLPKLLPIHLTVPG